MDAHGLEPQEKVPASRQLGRGDARAILAGSSRVIVAKGRRLDDVETAGAVDEEVVDLFLGATGNLRAPLVRTGTTTLVGFDAEAWSQALL
jgi:hypothetical protein